MFPDFTPKRKSHMRTSDTGLLQVIAIYAIIGWILHALKIALGVALVALAVAGFAVGSMRLLTLAGAPLAPHQVVGRP
jgi:hypothetical protein